MKRRPWLSDLNDWALDLAYRMDLRTPARSDARPGPWRDTGGLPAHGIYSRPANVPGLVEWAAAVDGWMVWRWSGPRMTWSSGLISPWNPILAQGMTLDEPGSWGWWRTPDLGDWNQWTCEAIAIGQKTGGYFGALLPWRRRAFVSQAAAAGLDVATDRWGAVFAAQPGPLDDHFDLAGLAAEYRRVLPGQLGERAAVDVLAAADLSVITAVRDHEELPAVVRGLALGYPPEVTAGYLLGGQHRRRGHQTWAEFGAYCDVCNASISDIPLARQHT